MHRPNSLFCFNKKPIYLNTTFCLCSTDFEIISLLDTMTLYRSMGLPIFVAAILSVVPIVGGRLVRFEHGYSYQYQYQANVTLEQVDTFQSAAKVCLIFKCLRS